MSEGKKVTIYAGSKAVQDMMMQVLDSAIAAAVEDKPLVGGTNENPTVVPDGPSGVTRKRELSPGFYTIGGVLRQAAQGKRWVWFWDKTSGSLYNMGDLPSSDTSGMLKKSDVGYDTTSLPNLFIASGREASASINTTSYAITRGQLAGFSISNRIPVTEAHRYRFEGRASHFAVRFEDNAGTLISGAATSGNPTSYSDFTAAAPTGAKFMYFGASRDGDQQDFTKITVTDLDTTVSNYVATVEGKGIVAETVKTGVKNRNGDTMATAADVAAAKTYADQQITANKISMGLVTDPAAALLIPASFEYNASIATGDFRIARGQTSGFSISNRVPAIAGHRYQVKGRVSQYAVRFENLANELISGVNVGATQAPDYTVTAPANCTGFYFGTSREGDGQVIANISVTDLDADAPPKKVKTLDGNALIAAAVWDGVKNESGKAMATEEYVDSKASNVNIHITQSFNESSLGAFRFPALQKYGIAHIVEYGQSLSVGGSSKQSITTVPVPRNFMLGTGVQDYASSTLNPLINTGNIEDAAVPMVNAFSSLFRTYVKDDIDFLATSSGTGGTVIDELMKNSLSGRTYYQIKFLAHLNNAKAAATAANKTIACPAIVYIQGESDYSSSKAHSVVLDAATTAERIALYKARLIQLKNDMQADIMAIYGQTEKPLFFVHNPQGGWATNVELFIHMAQIEACDENEDMILVGAPAFATRFGTGHLASNGYRWWGEHLAKHLYKTLIRGVKSQPIRPRRYVIDKNKIYIDYLVQHPPLKLDTWTVTASSQFGFNVRINESTWIAVTNVAIHPSGTTVILTLASDISAATAVRVFYSSRDSANNTLGQGNLCDSDTWASMYTYANDSTETSESDGDISYRALDKAGNPILGKKYPMQNWSMLFSDKIK